MADDVKGTKSTRSLVNEAGKPLYPKWVENEKGERVIVQTPDEEDKVAKKEKSVEEQSKDNKKQLKKEEEAKTTEANIGASGQGAGGWDSNKSN